jgi:O-antigen/teichoic acid export membrane protein
MRAEPHVGRHRRHSSVPSPAAVRTLLGNTLRAGGLTGAFSALAGTQAVNALLGLVFWTLATRLFPVAEVGVASATLSTVAWLAAIGNLGIGTLLIAELGRVDPADQRRLLGCGMTVAGVATGVLALAWLCVAPQFGENFASTRSGLLSALVFVACAAATSAAVTYDQAVLGVDDSHAQLIRNAVASASKVALLPVLALLTVRVDLHTVFAWAVTLVFSLLMCLPRLRAPASAHQLRRNLNILGLVRHHGRSALRHHLLNLALQSTPLLLPIVVTAQMSAREVAFFTSAWLLASSVFILPYMLTVALFSATVRNPESLAVNARRTLPFGLGISALALLVIVPASPLLLHIFGPAYSDGGASVLPWIAAAGLPLVIRDHYVAISRIRGQLSRATTLVAIATPFELLSATLGGWWGRLPGLCIGWVGVLSIEALLVLPVVLRAMLHGREEPGSGSVARQGTRRGCAERPA